MEIKHAYELLRPYLIEILKEHDRLDWPESDLYMPDNIMKPFDEFFGYEDEL